MGPFTLKEKNLFKITSKSIFVSPAENIQAGHDLILSYRPIEMKRIHESLNPFYYSC